MSTARVLADAQVSVSSAEAAVAGATAPTAETLAAELAVSATFGLALAGTSGAEKAINRLKDDSNAFASVNQAAAEAAEVSRTVRAQGQKEYYRMKSKDRNRR
jgi:hypothetical protein